MSFVSDLNNVNIVYMLYVQQNLASGIFRAKNAKEITFGGFSDGSVSTGLTTHWLLLSTACVIALRCKTLITVCRVDKSRDSGRLAASQRRGQHTCSQ